MTDDAPLSMSSWTCTGSLHPSLMRTVRAEVRRRAVHAGFAPLRVADVEIATSEALSNVVLHAYGADEPAGRVAVLIRAVDHALLVEVVDDGSGFGAAPRNPDGGRGLRIMSRIADEATVVSDLHGTRVRLRFDAERPTPR